MYSNQKKLSLFLLIFFLFSFGFFILIVQEVIKDFNAAGLVGIAIPGAMTTILWLMLSWSYGSVEVDEKHFKVFFPLALKIFDIKLSEIQKVEGIVKAYVSSGSSNNRIGYNDNFTVKLSILLKEGKKVNVDLSRIAVYDKDQLSILQIIKKENLFPIKVTFKNSFQFGASIRMHRKRVQKLFKEFT